MKKIVLLLCLLAFISIAGCAIDDSGNTGGRSSSGGHAAGCH